MVVKLKCRFKRNLFSTKSGKVHLLFSVHALHQSFIDGEVCELADKSKISLARDHPRLHLVGLFGQVLSASFLVVHLVAVHFLAVGGVPFGCLAVAAVGNLHLTVLHVHVQVVANLHMAV